MDNEKYSNYPLSISAILGLIEANDIAIPEIQRPFLKGDSEQTGLVNSIDKLYANLETNCVPLEAMEMDFNSYETFLDKRRKMMAAKIKKYYYSL